MPVYSPLAKLRTLLVQGVTPKELSLALTLGLVLGVTPVLGSTTLLCTVAAARLRLNLPAIHLVNWFAYPLQLALLIPFLKTGAWLFGMEFELPMSHIVQLVATEPWRAIRELWTATMHGLVAWAAVCSLAAVPLYLILLNLLHRLRLRAQ